MNKDFLKNKFSNSKYITFLQNFLRDFTYEESSLKLKNDSLFTNAQTLGHAIEGELTILVIKSRSTNVNNRISITKEAFSIMRNHAIGSALIAFDNGEDLWRLSLLTTSLKLNEKGKIATESSNPRRYSYLLGTGAKTVTPYKYLIEKGPVEDIEQLQERFSVEVVNKLFYTSIAELFTNLVGGERGAIKYPGLLKLNSLANQSIEHQEFAVRLIGRVIFCWFLKEKKSVTGVPIVPKELLSHDAVVSNADYYHSVLEPLFFELLNKRVEQRHENLRDVPFSKVPYLNGGLFSPQNNDFYNQSTNNGIGKPGLVHIPDSWFKDLFMILEQYNFTVDENTSYDVDLSIDPEMLGRIFENLLAEINPETGESARKSTGSFYTPREIVDYMVDSSLSEFLTNKTSITQDKLVALISWGQEDDEQQPLTVDEKERVVTALADLTILDPACGSGAFPIGILQKVVYILQQVDEKAELWFKNQLENIRSPELRRDIEEKYHKENYDYIRKLGVIRESIFGIDIQTIATEISRLRCFLTLIIEEEVDDTKVNRGVHALPNLDFKFVTANSLIGLPEDITNKGQASLLEDTNHIDTLKSIREEYFTAPNDRRNELEKNFYRLQKQMKDTNHQQFGGSSSSRYALLADWDPFEHKATEWFDGEWMFGLDGFDIVIGNPPYGENISLNTEKFRSLYKSTEGKFEIYKYFIERSIYLVNPSGVIALITPDTWLTLGYFNKIRRIVLNETSILQISNTIDKAFDSATVNTVVFILKKGLPNHTTLLLSGQLFKKTEINNFYDSNYIINLKKKDAVIDKLDGLKIKLGDQADVTQGLIAYASRKQDRTWTSKVKESEQHKKILYGREISRFSINWQGDYLKYGNWLHRKRPNYVFENPKIFIQRIRNPKLKSRLIAALDYDGYLATNGLSIILASEDGPSIELITGIINSKLINYWFGFHYKDVNIKPAQLRTIPLPDNLHTEITKIIINEVRKVSNSNNYNNESQDSIDKLVYELYELTPEEIAIIEKAG